MLIDVSVNLNTTYTACAHLAHISHLTTQMHSQSTPHVSQQLRSKKKAHQTESIHEANPHHVELHSRPSLCQHLISTILPWPKVIEIHSMPFKNTQDFQTQGSANYTHRACTAQKFQTSSG